VTGNPRPLPDGDFVFPRTFSAVVPLLRDGLSAYSNVPTHQRPYTRTLPTTSCRAEHPQIPNAVSMYSHHTRIPKPYRAIIPHRAAAPTRFAVHWCFAIQTSALPHALGLTRSLPHSWVCASLPVHALRCPDSRPFPPPIFRANG